MKKELIFNNRCVHVHTHTTIHEIHDRQLGWPNWLFLKKTCIMVLDMYIHVHIIHILRYITTWLP